MTFTEHQVEWIVTEVIRRLGLLEQDKIVTVGTAAPGAATELAMKDNVITLRSLEGKLAGVARLVIPPRAVVTPAVRDELNQRNIKLVRQA